MSKRRVAAAALIATGLMIAFVLWRGRLQPADHASTAATTRGKVSVEHNALDPATRVPRWFGQFGVSGRRIAGVVVGDDGAPVVGATVSIASTYSVAGLLPPASKLTDAAGRFDFGRQPASSFVVTAGAPKLTGALLWVDLRDPTRDAEQLRLVLHACDASIVGTIYDSSGGPIGGAVIARMLSTVTTTLAAEADDTGNYELCVPAGGASVVVSADGYAATSDNINVYGRTRRDFQLVPGATVIGRVVRADDKAAVPGAIVQLTWMSSRVGQLPLRTSTDADGRFHFDAVLPGRHVVTAYAERLASKEPVEAFAELGAQPAEIVCELSSAVNVSGRGVERGTQQPVAGRTIYLASTSRSPRDFARPVNAVTQADGSFVIERVLPGEYTLVAGRNDDESAQRVKVEAADITGLVVEIGATASIAGRVLYGGKPVDGALVRAADTATTTDAAGRFDLREVKPGTFKLYAESHLVGAFTQGPSITIAAGEHKKDVDIELDLAGSIAGVVVDQNDAPVGGVFLSFSLLRGRDFGSATTADDGTFTARSLSGGGDYVYEVRQRDGSAIIYPPATGKRHPPITVHDGQTHVTGVRVKIRYERLAISGRVTDAAGKPVADASVSAVPREERWYRMPSATSDQNGAFTVRDLPAGTYAVQATTPRGEAKVDGVAAGRTDVVLRMLEPGGIDGTLEGFKGTPAVVAYRIDDRQSFSRYTAEVNGTAFKLRNLPEGRYRISASASGDSNTAVVPVVAGQIKTVKLGVSEVGVLAGTVIDEKTRAPIAGIRCVSALQRMEEIDYESSRPEAKTDAKGAFRIERVPVGHNIVGCYGEDSTTGWQQAEVTTGQVTTIEVIARKNQRTPDPDKAAAGLTLEEQLGEVFVESVVPGGPAARAGIAVGDVIVSVDGKPIGRYQSDLAMRMIDLMRGGDSVPIVLERNDKQLTVQLKLEP